MSNWDQLVIGARPDVSSLMLGLMLDTPLRPRRGRTLSPDPALFAALERAASAIARLDQALDHHPLLPTFLHRARLEAVRPQAAVDGHGIDPWHLAAVPALTAQQTLERLVRESAPSRYSAGLPDDVERQLEHELRLIAELEYAPYFLTVHSIVRFAIEGNSVPGARQRGEQRCLVRARHHEYRSSTTGLSVRAFRLRRAQGAARYRGRFRARAAGRGHPVDL